MEGQQVWWIDYQGDVKSGTVIAVHENGPHVVRNGDTFEVKQKTDIYRSYPEAVATAANRLMREAATKQQRARELLTTLVKMASVEASK